MKYLSIVVRKIGRLLVLSTLLTCHNQNSAPSPSAISEIHLKQGNVISCGPAAQQFGAVSFGNTCGKEVEKDFNLAIELLHSFEYDEAEKAFAKVIEKNSACAMAYWGVAMSNFHPLWTPPTEDELAKGSKALAIAKAITRKSERETAYINALAAFYSGWAAVDHRTRCVRYEGAMQALHAAYPTDEEAAIFYALSLDAAADPSDQTFARQRKAGAILNSLYPAEPNHPGIIHYIIHTYDYPGLARTALPAARRYAQVAPSSAHALHMPSHIFTRLGLWDECIQSNLSSVASAKCYAQQAGIKGHWDEELHGLDYLTYAYLQKGDTAAARKQLAYLATIKEVHPLNFKVAYTFAAIPARLALETKNWAEAAALQPLPTGIPWANYPWQASITHFARVLGAVHTGNRQLAQQEWSRLQQLHDTLEAQKDAYKAKQVAIQVKAAGAWIAFAAGHHQKAIADMQLAADMEDSTEKHPVTPGEVLPARELLADMFFEQGDYKNALQAYEAVLQKSPNRRNSVFGARRCAGSSGDSQKAAIDVKPFFQSTAPTAFSKLFDRYRQFAYVHR